MAVDRVTGRGLSVRKDLERRLLDCLKGDHWEGRLSSSALSTAIAAFALNRFDDEGNRRDVVEGIRWLARNQNDDGGWGDTPESPSNLSATLLALATITIDVNEFRDVEMRGRKWLETRFGAAEGAVLVDAVLKQYGNDRTFSAPILTMCAMAGLLDGARRSPWRLVPPLPFELAVSPHCLFRLLNLTVVSYAIPALVAIGLLKHHKDPSANPFVRGLRSLSRRRALGVLFAKQPENGGFLEAAPLTGFVLMCLSEMGLRDHPVALKCAEFLKAGQRSDGSWPIDSNLSVWVTTLAVNALSAGEGAGLSQTESFKRALRDWLEAGRSVVVHSYTRAAPGGWPWTRLPGGVPDADDTAGALLAMRNLAGDEASKEDSVTSGLAWICGLQNRDGGVPTFCRGWGKLPFDRSCPEITAHAAAAVLTWIEDTDGRARKKYLSAIRKMADYLARSQRCDGAWIPLWFGNQHAANGENPVFGSARVIAMLNDAGFSDCFPDHALNGALVKAGEWLVSAQNPDGGWGGDVDVESTIEETAVAVSALTTMGSVHLDSVERGVEWLRGTIGENGGAEPLPAAPIGLYFASLWYDEAMYPLIFAVEALRRAEMVLRTAAN